MKTVLTVTHEGITYVDDDEESKFIDLIACNKNWIERQQGAGKKINAADLTYVGYRNVAAKRPFISFLTEPATKFEFADEDEYWKLWEALSISKWGAIDLS
jgi:hypothetical protein